MTKFIMASFIGCLILSALTGAVLATERNGAEKSAAVAAMRASYNAVAFDSRYDGDCLAGTSKDSNDYAKCLQKLPAHSLVGRGGY